MYAKPLKYAFVATLVACSHVQPIDYLKKIQQIGLSGQRQVAALDLTNDGKISVQDEVVLRDLSASLEQHLKTTAQPLTPPPDAPVSESPFQLIQAKNGTWNFSHVDEKSLQNLYPEVQWALKQTRVFAAWPHHVPLAQKINSSFSSELKAYDQDKMTPLQVCAAITKFDFSPWFKTVHAPSVVFDLDSTMWAGNVMDTFMALLAVSNKIPSDNNGNIKKRLLMLEGVNKKEVEKNDVHANARMLVERWFHERTQPKPQLTNKDMFFSMIDMLKGMTIADVDAIAQQTFHEGGDFLSTRLLPWKTQLFAENNQCGMRSLLQQFVRNGVKVYLMSATLKVLAEEGARLLAIPLEQVVGTEVVTINGVYTDKITRNVYATKGEIARQWLPSPPLFAFGDNPASDTAIMQEALVAAFMINPKEAFLQKDKEVADGKFVSVFFHKLEADLAGETMLNLPDGSGSNASSVSR